MKNTSCCPNPETLDKKFNGKINVINMILLWERFPILPHNKIAFREEGLKLHESGSGDFLALKYQEKDLYNFCQVIGPVFWAKSPKPLSSTLNVKPEN